MNMCAELLDDKKIKMVRNLNRRKLWQATTEKVRDDKEKIG